MHCTMLSHWLFVNGFGKPASPRTSYPAPSVEETTELLVGDGILAGKSFKIRKIARYDVSHGERKRRIDDDHSVAEDLVSRSVPSRPGAAASAALPSYVSGGRPHPLHAMAGAGPGADDMQALMRLLGGASLPDPGAVWRAPVRAHRAAPPAREAGDAPEAGAPALAPEAEAVDGGGGDSAGGDTAAARDVLGGEREEARAREVSAEDEPVVGARAGGAASGSGGGVDPQMSTGLAFSGEGAVPPSAAAVRERARPPCGEVAELNARDALGSVEDTMPRELSLRVSVPGPGSVQPFDSSVSKRVGSCGHDVPALDSTRTSVSESSVFGTGEGIGPVLTASDGKTLPPSEHLSLDGGIGPASIASAASYVSPGTVAAPVKRVRYSREQVVALRGRVCASFDASQLAAEGLLTRGRCAFAVVCTRQGYSREEVMRSHEDSLFSPAESECILPPEISRSPCKDSTLQSTARYLESVGPGIAAQCVQGGACLETPSSEDTLAKTDGFPPILDCSDETSALLRLPFAKDDFSAPASEVTAAPSDGQEIVRKYGNEVDVSEKSRVSRLPPSREGDQLTLKLSEVELIAPPPLSNARIRYSRDDVMALKCETCPNFDPSVLPRFLDKRGNVSSAVGRVVGLDVPLEVVQNRPDVALGAADENLTFEDMLLPSSLLSGLHSAGYYVPSPVQARGIPVGRLGVDLIAQAKSGTGKTLVFSALALETYIMASHSASQISALVLTPTRDIAAQVRDVMEQIAVRVVPRPRIGLLIGGTSVKADEIALREHGFNIVVGTPGRVEHMLERDSLNLSALKLLVVDEADRTLDGSFEGSVPAICERLPASKQVLTFSATYSAVLLTTLRSIMRSPQFINLCGSTTDSSDSSRDCPTPRESSNCDDRNEAAVLLAVRQSAIAIPVSVVGSSIVCTDFDNVACLSVLNKHEGLVAVLSSQPFGQAIVFTNDKVNGCIIKTRLCDAGFATVYMSGSELQSVRRTSMQAMRSGCARVLVSTDLVARGVDLPGCDFVVHLDLPQDSATYLHRVGRAGRFGSKGASVILYWDGGEERRHVEHLQRELRVTFEMSSAGSSRKCSESVESRLEKIGFGYEGVPSVQSSLHDNARQELLSPRTDEEGGHEEEASSSPRGEESASSEEALLRSSSEAGNEFLTSVCTESLAAENNETSFVCTRAAEDVAVYRQEAISNCGTAAASSPSRASYHEDEWSTYAESAFNDGYADGYRMAFRMAARLSKRLGQDGLLSCREE